MKILNLCAGSEMYTSNAYRCTREDGKGPGGCSNTKEGCGILIDTGCDPAIIPLLRQIESEEQRQPICQVVLTHSHYDHSKMLNGIKDIWPVKTFAFSAYVAGVDQIVKGEEKVLGGGYIFDLIHVPGHSTDSLCIYCEEERILFSGDTPLVIWGTEGTYELPFVRAFEILASLDVQCIYPGHGDPIMTDCNRILDQSLRNLRKSRLI
jgi:glyoxylase-like metal-dependent hydrolase (beta-lactamase superfamily II)